MQERQLEDYRTLYAEIDRNSQISTTVFLAAITVTSALIGYGLSSGIGPIFLSPFAIIIPSILFITSQLESTTRIAAYIMVFLETGSEELNWQTRWFEIRRRKLLPRVRKYTFSISGLYGALAIACIILTFLYWNMEWWIFAVIVAPLIFLTFFGVFYLRRAFSFDFCKRYVEQWIELKNEEK
ncbi:hypothetical protein ACFLW4_01285 [Chloroflexota bacterium]